jgi:hypothetical protein
MKICPPAAKTRLLKILEDTGFIVYKPRGAYQDRYFTLRFSQMIHDSRRAQRRGLRQISCTEIGVACVPAPVSTITTGWCVAGALHLCKKKR